MIINQANLSRAFTGFQTIFNQGLAQAPTQWNRVATRVPSTSREEKYGWLGQVPGMREWIGDRVLQSLAAHDYTIKNKPWELTVEVERDDMEDDNYGVYAPLFQQMGWSAAAKPDELVYPLLKAGFASVCYDGQYFFDTDHPVLDANGVAQSMANTDGGAGAAWFLICANRPILPIIFQDRKSPQFVAMDRPDDENVFMRKKFRYGVDMRGNGGYGLWQLAWGSKQTLDAAHYQTARAALSGMKGDYGRPLGLMPNLLVVDPSNEGKGRALLTAEKDAAGADNVWKGTAELLVVPWLA